MRSHTICITLSVNFYCHRNEKPSFPERVKIYCEETIPFHVYFSRVFPTSMNGLASSVDQTTMDQRAWIIGFWLWCGTNVDIYSGNEGVSHGYIQVLLNITLTHFSLDLGGTDIKDVNIINISLNCNIHREPIKRWHIFFKILAYKLLHHECLSWVQV